jgi:hypothetical protein
MGDLLKVGSDWLQDQLKTHASQSVIYQRGTESVGVAATIGKTIFEVDDGYGVVEKIESRDFLIHAAELILGESQTLPERGDRIRETQGAVIYIYEVMAPGKEPHYRFSDSYRKQLRIHTKHVDTEDAD